MRTDMLEAEQLELIPLKKPSLHLVSSEGGKGDDEFQRGEGEIPITATVP